jgi:hypothetical protein
MPSRQGAHDFVEHESVSAQAVVDAVGDACARSCRGHETVLVVLDGRSLTLTDEQRNKGFGKIGGRWEQAQGVKVMNTVALSTQGEVLGIPAQRYWMRTGPAKRHGYRLPSA